MSEGATKTPSKRRRMDEPVAGASGTPANPAKKSSRRTPEHARTRNTQVKKGRRTASGHGSTKGTKLFQYDPSRMSDAIEAARKGMAKSKAARMYGVPRTTLVQKLKGRGKPPQKQKVGPVGVFSEDEEAELEKWLYRMAETGFPVTMDQLLDNVRDLITNLNRKTPFKEDRPGRKWLLLFKRRHPEITSRLAQNLSRSRATLTKESLQGWFRDIQLYLSKNNLLDVVSDPKRVFNMDESAFFLSPTPGKVLVNRNSRVTYNFSANSDRECTTVLLGGNAAGDLVPPYAIFKLKSLNHVNFEQIPKHWGYGKTISNVHRVICVF